MLYDNYQKKIFRIANTLKKLIALIPKIIAVLVAILVLFVAFAVTKGIFIKQVECADSFVYGDTIDCKANALFSAVRYEYAEKGSDNWQSIAPNSPGEYRVRAVSKTLFGGFKYGDERIFKILPKTAGVFVAQSNIVYGEMPSVDSKELVNGDRIECTNVLYNDIVQKSTQVVPDVEKLKIFDVNGNDVTAAYDISPISTEITILPRALAVLVSDQSREYNGIKFAYDQYEISSGSLKDGDQLRATFDKYLIDVGSIVNQPQLQIVTDQGKDVTHHYEITETVGMLSVEKRPIIISVQNLSQVYDAQEHSNYDFLVDPSTTIVSGHKINVISGTVAENVGSYENILIFEIVDAQGEVKTDNYSLLIEKGSIDITPRPITVTTMDESCLYDGEIHSGSKYTVEGLLGDYHFAKLNNAVSMENVGTQDNVIDILIYDIQDPGKSQMANYEISYVYGTFEIEARPITVKAPSAQWIYDGMPHEYVTPEIVSELGLVNSQQFIVNGYSTITDVGAIENVYTEYYVLEGKEDRTNNYDITWEYGILEVLPRPIVVSPETVEKYYDDTPLVPNKAGIAGDSPYLLVEGHTIVADVSGSRTEAGESKSLVENVEIFDGSRNVSHNYDISTANGIIRVLKRPISVVVKDARKIYDGTPLTSEEYDLLPMGNLDFALVQGHRLDVVIFGSQTEAGQSPNCVNLAKSKIYNENGLDVTKNYQIEKVDGTLTVVPRKIIIHILDATKVYDGTPLTSNLHEVLATDLLPIALIEGHRMDLHTTGQQTDVGKSINEPDMLLTRIYDTDDRDVTDNYTITYTAGFLIVTPRAIIVDVTNASKVYDGTPLTSDAHEVLRVDPLEFALVEGHAVKLVTLGSQTDVGVSENFADPDATRIFDESGRDVTFNYSISFIEGLLEVTPRPIIVQVSYESKQYDRTPLTSNKFTVQYEAPLEFGLVDGHQVHLVTLGSQTEIGESINAVDTDNFRISDENDRNVTFNYSVSFVDGILKVIPRQLTVSVTDAAKCYDGTPLISHVYEAIGLLEGDRIELVIVGSQTEIGSSANVAAPDATMIYDADGNDVMHHYDITYKDGTLTVVPNAVLLIKTESAQKEYDATPLTNPNYSIEILDGAIAPNHNLSVNVYGSQTEVGVSENFCEISITDEFGNIVSSNYKCLFELGTLKVTKKVEEPEEPDLPDLPENPDNPDNPDNPENPGGNLDTSGQISGGDILEGEPDGEVVVLKLRADRTGRIYLRLMSFGAYCGSNWDSAYEYGPLLDGKYSYNYLTGVALQNLGTAPTFLEIESFTSDYLLPYYLGVGEGNYMLQASDVKYMSDGAKEYTLSYYVYEGYGVGMAGNLGEYADEEREYRAFVRDQYLALDDVTRAYMLKLIAEQKFDRKDPEIIKKVANYIQNAATYNLQYDRALDAEENIAIAFLETYKEGICQHYATSAVLLYRALGIPARYTIGFVADSVAGEWVEVTPMTAHAWVEVYINGFGWISVEVTGGGFSGGGSGGNVPEFEETILESIYIAPTYTYKNYDGTLLYAQNKVDVNHVLSDLLKLGYTYEVEVSGKRTKIGRTSSSIEKFVLYDPNGKDVTSEFNIIMESGVVEVFEPDKKILPLYLYELQKYYDGEVLEFDSDCYEVIDPFSALKLDIQFNISLESAGSIILADINKNIDQYVSYTIYIDGVDVTHEYSIVFDLFDHNVLDYVPIRVDRRNIELSTASETKIYDGTPLSNPNVMISKGTLVSGDTLMAQAVGFLTDVGSSKNFLNKQTVQINDENGNDVTKNYKISVVFGVLEILPSDE